MFRILTVSLALVALGALPVASESAQARVVRELRALGYTEITGKETWLGRYRIVATAPGQSREIVLNPYTGEVLRDYVRRILQPEEGEQVSDPATDDSQPDKTDGQSGNSSADGQSSGEAGNGAGNSGSGGHE